VNSCLIWLAANRQLWMPTRDLLGGSTGETGLVAQQMRTSDLLGCSTGVTGLVAQQMLRSDGAGGAG